MNALQLAVSLAILAAPPSESKADPRDEAAAAVLRRVIAAREEFTKKNKELARLSTEWQEKQNKNAEPGPDLEDLSEKGLKKVLAAQKKSIATTLVDSERLVLACEDARSAIAIAHALTEAQIAMLEGLTSSEPTKFTSEMLPKVRGLFDAYTKVLQATTVECSRKRVLLEKMTVDLLAAVSR